MHQLLYASITTPQFDQKKDIPDILAKSQKNNTRDNLTGILLYNSGIFIQLLEGSLENTEAAFERISKDTRHSKVVKIFSKIGNERIFSQWKMAYKEINQEIDLKMINDVLNWNTLFSKTQNINNQQVLKMLSYFKEKIDNQILNDHE